jgi:2-furoyl-CoA dehydrogenase large subunit
VQQDKPFAIDRPYLGRSVERVEDAALLTGRGAFIDDLGVRPGTLYAAFVRSPFPHAGILKVDLAAALAMPSVACALTGAELAKLTRPFTVGVKVPLQHFALAVDRVRYVGEPVAIVCAETPYLAEDAAARIDLELERLPAIVDPLAAMAPNAPLLHETAGSNVVSDRTFSYGDPAQAFAQADRIIDITVRYPRNSVTPIECYGVIASYDAGEDAYDVTANFQGPFAVHPVMALALGVPSNRLRLKTPPDSGGSFGTKQGVFPYIVALCVLARKAGRPVKWVEDRLEHLSAATSATNRVTTLKAAIRNDGLITALDWDQIDDCGAYLKAPEPATLYRMHGNMTGAYRIAHLAIRNRIVLTNKTPTGLVRGFGGPQVYFALERLTARIAKTIGREHLEVMSRNMIAADDFPYRTAAGGVYDSGNYEAAIELAERADLLPELRFRRDTARAEGKLYGIGLAAIVEPSISNMGYITTVLTQAEREKAGPKGGAVATATVAVDALGGVSVHVSSVPQGQGHKTVLAQAVADVLGLGLSDVRVVTEIDTGRDAWSVASGNYSSRFAGAVAGTAHLAAARLRDRIADMVAPHLRCEPGQVRFADGKIFAEGDRAQGLLFRRLAATSHWAQSTLPQGMEPVLRETAFWSPPSLTPPNAQDEINSSATHGLVLDLCGVEIDPDTGKVRIDRYVTIHDAGRILHPGMADGQIRGGFSNAVGAALYEHLAYGHDGSFLSGTFADYPVPTAMEVPDIEIHHIETPSPVTPLGAKGIGEGNCMSTPVALANAVADALGIDDAELPLTPSRVLDLLGRTEPPRPKRATLAMAAEMLTLSRGDYGLKGEGSQLIAAKPEMVWAVLLDDKTLKDIIPGCRTLVVVAPNHYAGEISMGAGPVKGVFAAEVRLSDLDPPRALRLSGSTKGVLGRSDGEAVVSLIPEGAGTRLSYRYGVDFSGKVAAVGGRMLAGASRMLIAEFFGRLAVQAAPEAKASALSRRGAASPVHAATAEPRGWLRRLIGRDKGGGEKS